MTAPRLDTPEGRAAYRTELRGVARGWRWGGLLLIVAGAGLGSVERFTAQPMPSWTTTAVLVLFMVGWAMMMVAIIQRTLHHRRRLSGQPGSK
jgi:predicted phage tail protein